MSSYQIDKKYIIRQKFFPIIPRTRTKSVALCFMDKIKTEHSLVKHKEMIIHCSEIIARVRESLHDFSDQSCFQITPLGQLNVFEKEESDQRHSRELHFQK